MRHDTSIDLSGSGTLARRQMVKVLASVVVGVVARPLMSPLAAAAEIGNSTRMVAAIIFESHLPDALRRAGGVNVCFSAAVSTRRCNTSVKPLCWGFDSAGRGQLVINRR